MKASTVVTLCLTTLAVSACGGPAPDPKRCVDRNGIVVEEAKCWAENTNRQSGGIMYVPMYQWHYGGSGGYNLGSRVIGGGYAPVAGHSYTTGSQHTSVGRPGVTRGIFGGSGSSRSSFGG